jgi:hypothetical protein
VGGRGKRKDDRERSSKDEIFDTEKDWVDDEGIAPGLID